MRLTPFPPPAGGEPTGMGFHHSSNMDQGPDVGPASQVWEQE